MPDTVFTGQQKGNPMIACGFLRIAAPPHGRSERQAETEVRVDVLERLLAGRAMRACRGVSWGAAAGRTTTAGVCLSRHGCRLYLTSPPPATAQILRSGWRQTVFPVTRRSHDGSEDEGGSHPAHGDATRAVARDVPEPKHRP